MVSGVLENTTRVIMFEGFRIASLYILLGNEGEATQVQAWYLKSEGPAGGDLCVIQTSTAFIALNAVVSQADGVCWVYAESLLYQIRLTSIASKSHKPTMRRTAVCKSWQKNFQAIRHD